MIFFDKTRTIGQDANGKNVVWVSIYVDTAANLPAYNDYQSDGFILCMASEGRCIDTGDLYLLDSAGTWQISQAGTGTYTKAEIDALLNAKQNTLTFDATPTQNSTNPVTSGGIWTDQQRQETEIGVVANAGAKNLLPMTHKNGSITKYGVTCAWDSNSGTMTLNGAHSSGDSAAIFEFYDGTAEATKILPAGAYTLTGCPVGGSTATYRAVLSQITGAVDIGNGANFELSEPHYAAYRILISGNVNFDNMIFKPMIRPAAITDPTFQPYARTNPELTVLTDEDRAALVELVDSGAKNVLKLGFTTKTAGTVTGTMTADGNGIVVNGERTQTTDAILVYDLITNESASQDTRYTLPAGQYVLNAALTYVQVQIYCHDGTSGSLEKLAQSSTSAVEFEYTAAKKKTKPYLCVRVWIARSHNYDNETIYPMICTKAAWKISQAYQPYRPSWQEMYGRIVALENG